MVILMMMIVFLFFKEDWFMTGLHSLETAT